MDFSLIILTVGASMALTTFILSRKPTWLSEDLAKMLRGLKVRERPLRDGEGKEVKVVDVYDPTCFLQTPPPLSLDELIKYGYVKGVLVLVEEVPWSTALRELESKIMTYKVMLERNPSNKKVEKRLKTLEHIYSSMVSRGNALRARVLLIARKRDVESLKALLKRVEDSGCRARLVGLNDLLELMLGRYKLGALTDSSQVEFVLEPALARVRLMDYAGIYVGRELATGMPVYISLWERGARHVLILGPTGRGKTTLLSTIIKRLDALEEGILAIAVDPKGDLVEQVTSSVECRVISVDKEVLAKLVALAVRYGAQLSAVVSSGVELSSRESALLDSLEACSAHSFRDMYAKSLTVKLSAVGVDLSALCSLMLQQAIEEDLCSKIGRSPGEVVVFDLSRLSDGGRNVAIASILSVVIGCVERLGPAQKLRVALAIDEAWRLKSIPGSILSRLFREGRSYGVSVLMAVQDPEEVPETAWNNASIVFAFGSHDRAYVEKVSRVLKLDASDRERVQWLKRGEVLLRYQWDPRPLFVVVDVG